MGFVADKFDDFGNVFACDCGDGYGVGEFLLEVEDVGVVFEFVDFIEEKGARLFGCTDVVEDFHDGIEFLLSARIGDVEDDEEKVGVD